MHSGRLINKTGLTQEGQTCFYFFDEDNLPHKEFRIINISANVVPVYCQYD